MDKTEEILKYILGSLKRKWDSKVEGEIVLKNNFPDVDWNNVDEKVEALLYRYGFFRESSDSVFFYICSKYRDNKTLYILNIKSIVDNSSYFYKYYKNDMKEYIEKCIIDEPENGDYYLILRTIGIRQKNYKEAIDNALKLIKISPTFYIEEFLEVCFNEYFFDNLSESLKIIYNFIDNRTIKCPNTLSNILYNIDQLIELINTKIAYYIYRTDPVENRKKELLVFTKIFEDIVPIFDIMRKSSIIIQNRILNKFISGMINFSRKNPENEREIKFEAEEVDVIFNIYVENYQLKKRNSELQNEIDYIAENEAYKPEGIIAKKVEEHFNKVSETQRSETQRSETQHSETQQ